MFTSEEKYYVHCRHKKHKLPSNHNIYIYIYHSLVKFFAIFNLLPNLGTFSDGMMFSPYIYKKR